ncbi:hypothetical protein AWJ20_5104 [Sugiyamaella lignohabitans]|uniref:SP-RING-type domain-containing protein n=1 Tax=Sugiyamaella lignohabitans TaxID=796027 RepID=A0A167EJA3_9ASCO|nr:uncharacterized protein AWJ20_5104 [Sugiyamaella lignohabitans]ANB14146.1 hypothetical protein AWJ20_5104 [Sugiyamaella lignohabitans]
MPRRKRSRVVVEREEEEEEEEYNEPEEEEEEENEEEYNSQRGNEEPEEEEEEEEPEEGSVLLYPREFGDKYHRYAVPQVLLSSITKTQNKLEESAKILEEIRVLYTEDEAGDDAVMGEVFSADKQKEETYGTLVNTVDQAFKLTLTAAEKSQFIKRSVDDGYNYIRTHRLPDSVVLGIHNVDELSQARPLDEVLETNYKERIDTFKSLPQSKQFEPPYLLGPYKKFRTAIFDVSHDASEEMPSIQTFYDDNDEDDLVEARAVISFKCPLTKQYFEDPVTSSVCNHSFSRVAIMEVLSEQTAATGAQTIKCPVSACQHFFGTHNLRPNPQLAQRANVRKQRELKESQRRDIAIEAL